MEACSSEVRDVALHSGGSLFNLSVHGPVFVISLNSQFWFVQSIIITYFNPLRLGGKYMYYLL
jgi:hypothetical protein